jgi:small-conductance mechanosensitive channel
MNLPTRIAEVIKYLDSIGFDYGNTRLSLFRAVLVLIVIALVYAFGRLGNRGVKLAFRRLKRLEPAQQVLGEKVVGILVWLLCILIGIDFLGIDLTALTVFSGAFGLAVGFGLQKTFGNLLAGIILLMDRSIKPGDVIAVGNQGGTGTVGQVNRIGMRAISVITRDKVEFLIPNENLMINQVENWSYSSLDVRVKVPVTVSFETDIDLAEELMLRAARESRRVLANPEPTVWLHSFGENGIMFEIQIWIEDPEEGLGNVRSDVLKRLWRLFKENGVEVPFPQRVVHVRSKEAPAAQSDA